jgi:hypothetical protein
MTKLRTAAGSQVDVPEELARTLLAGSGFVRIDVDDAPPPGSAPKKAKPLARWTVPELRAHAEGLGLAVEGFKKDALIAAIQAAEEAPSEPVEPEPVDDDQSDDDE